MVLLAHVGSFLPCEDAIIGIVDRIFTRIESVETWDKSFNKNWQMDYLESIGRCTIPQSTFTIDLNQMVVVWIFEIVRP